MNTTKAKHTSHVQPSSRDPITNWLDVFTKLLAVPPAEKARIRDELEDHLRMRVEDLLILGMTEPEAVQKAVAELGETAALARGFKEARTSTRRRILMHTALFAAAGLALTMSASNILPVSNTMTPATNHREIAVIQPEESARSGGVLDFDIEQGTLEEALTNIGAAADSRLFVHWGSLESVGVDRDTPVGDIPSRGLELSKVRELLNSMLGLEDGSEITARMDDGLLEFATVSYFDKREIITMDHDVSDLVPAEHILDFTQEAENLRNGIVMVLEPSVWQGNLCAIAVNGSQLSIRAPERVQVQVIDYIARLRKAEEIRSRENAKEVERAIAEAARNREIMIEEYQQILDETHREIDEVQGQREGLNLQYWDRYYAMNELEQHYKQTLPGDEKSSARDRLVHAQAEHEALDERRDSLTRRLEDLHNRVRSLQNNIAVTQLQIGQDEQSGVSGGRQSRNQSRR